MSILYRTVMYQLCCKTADRHPGVQYRSVIVFLANENRLYRTCRESAENGDVTALLLEVIYHPKIVFRGGDGWCLVGTRHHQSSRGVERQTSPRCRNLKNSWCDGGRGGSLYFRDEYHAIKLLVQTKQKKRKKQRLWNCMK